MRCIYIKYIYINLQIHTIYIYIHTHICTYIHEHIFSINMPMQYLNLCMHVYVCVFVVYFKSNKTVSFFVLFVYLLLMMTTLS